MPNRTEKIRKARPGRVRKRRGDTLVEILIALDILAVVVPVSFGALSTVFTSELRLHQRAEKALCAEWWFNRLETPLSASGLSAAPQMDGRGKMRFSWEASPLEYGALSNIGYPLTPPVRGRPALTISQASLV